MALLANATNALVLLTPRGRILDRVNSVLASLLFGIVVAFHFRQAFFHRPLAFVTLALIGGLIVAGWLIRSERRRSHSAGNPEVGSNQSSWCNRLITPRTCALISAQKSGRPKPP